MDNIKALLNEPVRILIRQLHEQLAQAGYADIRPAHSQVFQYLGKHGARITELAERAQMTKQSMSTLVYDMENAGYLKRFLDKTDKRAIVFKLTPKGQKASETAGKIIKGILAKWTAQMGESRMKELVNLLTELNNKIL